MGLFGKILNKLNSAQNQLNYGYTNDIVESFFENFDNISTDADYTFGAVFQYTSQITLSKLGDSEKKPLLKSSNSVSATGLNFIWENINAKIDAVTKEGKISGQMEKGIMKVQINGNFCGEVNFKDSKILTKKQEGFILDRPDSQVLWSSIPIGGKTGIQDRVINIKTKDQNICTLNIYSSSNKIFTNISKNLTDEAKSIFAAILLFELTVYLNQKVSTIHATPEGQVGYLFDK